MDIVLRAMISWKAGLSKNNMEVVLVVYELPV